MVMIRPQHGLCGAGRALQGNRKKRRCDLSLYIRVDSHPSRSGFLPNCLLVFKNVTPFAFTGKQGDVTHTQGKQCKVGITSAFAILAKSNGA